MLAHARSLGILVKGGSAHRSPVPPGEERFAERHEPWILLETVVPKDPVPYITGQIPVLAGKLLR